MESSLETESSGQDGIGVEVTRVHSISSRPNDTSLTSVLIETPGPSYSDTGSRNFEPADGSSCCIQVEDCDNDAPLPINSSLVPSSTRIVRRPESGCFCICNKFVHYHKYAESQNSDEPEKNTCAILIGGRGVKNVYFTENCFRDVENMRSILSEPIGMIPQNNIFLITPSINHTEFQINAVFDDVTKKRPTKLILSYSGHGLDKFLSISDDQGNALSVRNVNNFLHRLLPRCSEIITILDCCSAAENVLLPALRDGEMPQRNHIQLASCKKGGMSYMCDHKSIFTDYIISALRCKNKCPNLSENCPICNTFRTSIIPTGRVTWHDLMAYAVEHMKHRYPTDPLSYLDLPLLMGNPVSRE